MKTQKTTNRLLWILSLALLLVIYLYLPIVSPDLYHSEDYLESQQGVSFHGKITNAPKSIKNNENYQETEVPIVINSYTNSSVNHISETSNSNHNAQFQSNGLESVNSRISMTSTVGQSSGISYFGKANVTSGIGLSGLSSNYKKSGLSQASNTTGFSNLSEELAATNELSNRQSAGGPDPGGDPAGDPLPVGDGFWVLVVFAMGFIAWKYKKTTNSVVN